MGAMPAARTWQQYKPGIGPWIDGIFSQSNFGVVTKMGFWLMPEPEAFMTGTVYVPRYNDLAQMVDIMNYLENTNAVHGMPILGTPLLQGALEGGQAERAEVADMVSRGASWQELEAYGLEHGIPYWSVTLKYYGPEKAIRALWEHAQERYAAIEGVSFEDGEFHTFPVDPDNFETEMRKVEFGIPNLAIFSIGARTPTNPTPTNGHIWFSPIIPRTGEAIIEANRVFDEVAKELDVPFLGFALPTTYWNRAFIYLFGFPITRDPEKDAKMRDAFRRIVKVAASHGWGEYRTAPAFQDDVVGTYAFNDHALLRFNERLKDAIDPNGILAAGRYGIWPKHLRKARK
jgi:4-cresol dehydrogenase (hydroxylating)